MEMNSICQRIDRGGRIGEERLWRKNDGERVVLSGVWMGWMDFVMSGGGRKYRGVVEDGINDNTTTSVIPNSIETNSLQPNPNSILDNPNLPPYNIQHHSTFHKCRTLLNKHPSRHVI